MIKAEVLIKKDKTEIVKNIEKSTLPPKFYTNYNKISYIGDFYLKHRT